ncbi:unnamed protein product [Oppiella nova]|uniref:Uncharacterized protein n=1 Tax=Oppiella nova TaxID=334625 RepID=A0A7R9LUG5_9ACAR|nr:unnamed protein product [Oppiella nova]CAG2167118.1 unnamed protein product [Oppiella nova]
MSSEDEKHKTSEQFSGGVPPVAPTTSSAGGAPPTPRTADKSLSTLEKIKRFFFSKEEWEAYLLERLEEENRKKESSGQRAPRELHRNVTLWLETMFATPEEADLFLRSQLDKLQSERSAK